MEDTQTTTPETAPESTATQARAGTEYMVLILEDGRSDGHRAWVEVGVCFAEDKDTAIDGAAAEPHGTYKAVAMRNWGGAVHLEPEMVPSLKRTPRTDL